jgi:hypothetical protein
MAFLMDTAPIYIVQNNHHSQKDFYACKKLGYEIIVRIGAVKLTYYSVLGITMGRCFVPQHDNGEMLRSSA